MHTAHPLTTARKPLRPFAEAQSGTRLRAHVLARLEAGDKLVRRQRAYPDGSSYRHAPLGSPDAGRTGPLLRQTPFVEEKKSSWRPFG